MSVDKQYKKLILKIKYLKLEIDDCEEHFSSISKNFDNGFMEYCKTRLGDDYFKNQTSEEMGMSKSAKAARKRNPQAPPQYTPNQSEDTQNITKRELKPAKKRKIPAVFRTMYKQIASHTHPDRCIYLNPDSDEYKLRNRMYIRATNALEDCDYEVLLDVFIELELELPEANKDIIVALEKKIETLAKNIHQIKSSPVWIWGHSALEKQKIIFEHIFKQRYKK